MSDLEVKTERDQALEIFGTQQWTPCVRVLYRRPPARRWTRVLVRVEDGLTLEEIEDRAYEIAARHERPFGPLDSDMSDAKI